MLRDLLFDILGVCWIVRVTSSFMQWNFHSLSSPCVELWQSVTCLLEGVKVVDRCTIWYRTGCLGRERDWRRVVLWDNVG